MSGLIIASDGLPARVVQPWAKEKLHYLERYIDAFTTAMRDKWNLAYIDLFSGPGRSIIEGTKEEIDGSPLVALRARYPFHDVFLNDADPEAVEALRARVSLVQSGARITINSGDCNAAAIAAGNTLFGGSMRSKTLALAFVDPTAFAIGLEALARLTKGRRVDLLITVMTGYMKRFSSQSGFQDPMDHFFGSPDWHDLVESSDAVTTRGLLDHYEDRLRDLGYEYFHDDIRITNSKEAPLYHLVFASKHPLGGTIFKNISRKNSRGQRRLDL
jgi:three-Cys-motif partner protein